MRRASQGPRPTPQSWERERRPQRRRAPSTTPRDFGFDLAGAVSTRGHRTIGAKEYWEHSAPTVWPPPESYREIEAISAELLAGPEYRRRSLWRYTVLWRKPR